MDSAARWRASRRRARLARVRSSFHRPGCIEAIVMLKRVDRTRAAILDEAENLAMISRLTRDLPSFARTPFTVEAARRRVRMQLERREERFLDLVDRGVYRFPSS